MNKKAICAALQARPWLNNSLEYFTGATEYTTYGLKGAARIKIIGEWVNRNVSEIAIRQFSDLNLDEKAQVTKFPIKDKDEFKFSSAVQESLMYDQQGVRDFQVVIKTRFSCFTHQTYVADKSIFEKEEKNFLTPHSQYWDHMQDQDGNSTIRKFLECMFVPHHVSIGGERKVITNPFIFDAIVRITQVGISGRCSSTIVDVFPFPPDFNRASF